VCVLLWVIVADADNAAQVPSLQDEAIAGSGSRGGAVAGRCARAASSDCAFAHSYRQARGTSILRAAATGSWW